MLTFCDGGNASFSVFKYQHVGIPNEKFSLRGLDQCEAPMQEVCVTVEYRLNTLDSWIL